MGKYTKKQQQRIKEKILNALASGDVSMAEICAEDNMPNRTTIFRWRAKDPEFDKACEEANKGGFDKLAERVLSKFDDLDFTELSIRCAKRIMGDIKKKLSHELNDEQIDIIRQILEEHAVDPKFANAEVQKVTNQFRAAMMFLSKRHPAKYGDRLDISQTIEDKREYTPAEREERLKTLLERRKQILDDDQSNTKH